MRANDDSTGLVSMTAAPPSVAERLYEAAAPLAFSAAWCIAWASGAARVDLDARRGRVAAATGPVVWLHGASAGELRAATSLVAMLREAGHRFVAAYTTTNQAGLDVARREAAGNDLVSLAPWDSRRWLAATLEAWQPRLLCLVETELWPGLLLEAGRRGVPVVCVSARIYPRDVPRYRWARPLIERTLGRLSAVFAQSEEELGRFVELGADSRRCFVAGNLKHLRSPSSDGRLRAELGVEAEEPIVVAGSVHADEIDFVLTGLEAARSRGVRVVVAPRHAVAAAALVEAAAVRGWTVARRSRRDRGDWTLLVLDTMGELADAYALASIAVIGGSFANHGGHNPFEAVLAGAPVVFGARTHHFADETAALSRTEPPIRSMAELASRIGAWLDEPHRRRDALDGQRRALPNPAAIAARYLELLSPWLERALGDRAR